MAAVRALVVSRLLAASSFAPLHASTARATLHSSAPRPGARVALVSGRWGRGYRRGRPPAFPQAGPLTPSAPAPPEVEPPLLPVPSPGGLPNQPRPRHHLPSPSSLTTPSTRARGRIPSHTRPPGQPPRPPPPRPGWSSDPQPHPCPKSEPSHLYPSNASSLLPSRPLLLNPPLPGQLPPGGLPLDPRSPPGAVWLRSLRWD